MRLRALLVALVLTSASFAESEGSADRYLFEAGGHLQFGLPGQFKPNNGGVTDNGVAFGYGFQFGWRAMPVLTVQAMLDALAHGVSVPAPSTIDAAVQVSAGLGTKIFGLVPFNGPRLYLLLGFAFTRVIYGDDVDLLSTDSDKTNTVALKGWRKSVGVGYEYEVAERATLYAEVDFTHTVLNKRTFKSAQPVTLNPSVNRWVPTLRVGCVAVF